MAAVRPSTATEGRFDDGTKKQISGQQPTTAAAIAVSTERIKLRKTSPNPHGQSSFLRNMACSGRDLHQL